MQASLEEVERQCAPQLRNFMDCVDQHPDYHVECKFLKQQVTFCAEQAVPSLKKIKENCKPVIQNYQRCLELNENPSKCQEWVQMLNECHKQY
ncbi:hypothetical protein EDD86DRAFT_212127 [Gorgonomyces haynaldii]|nr:hypothetical protein EDD86DRAFT_212127 [Gorgonomyces haynaldii]